jgi:hypothetical protein
VKDQDWLVRLRTHLGIVPKSMEKIPSIPKPKPLQPDLPLAKLSCPFPAGSIEKIAVMRARAEAGRSLFHPGDNRDVLVRQSHAYEVVRRNDQEINLSLEK